MIKYADNILKNFSTAISIIISSIISWMFMGFNLTALFIVGVAMVNYAVYLYGKREPPVIGGGCADDCLQFFHFSAASDMLLSSTGGSAGSSRV